MCSTPVGVKDRFTTTWPGGRLGGRCAQRLSASKIGSHGPAKTGPHASWGCSTPVGVKDRFTRDANGIKKPRGCAQRLSASKIGSRQGLRRDGPRPRVLNACRRQRSVHFEYALRVAFDSLVLNACRRQRSVHLRRIGDGLLEEDVLNACRRQRSVHTIEELHAALIVGCSTPVGVKDRFTHYGDTAPRSKKCAQRLSASKIGSRCRRRRSFCDGWRAQRLSASKIGSPVVHENLKP